MLEWTGERFLPWLAESTIGYEHLHRYRYAATLVTGKRVLDLASGEGYGSKILAETASSVVGVDIDENAICHATQRYGREALQFIIGSITAVPISENHSFDVIVCFEAIEHIEEQEKLLGEVKRLLKPDGVFIVSTPNKVAYQDISAEANPFHVKELDLDQFHQLLGRHFGNIRFLGQRIHPGSSIWPIGSNDSSVREFVMERGESEFRFIGNEKRVPLYFIALASNSPAPLQEPGSVLLDHSNGLIHEKDKELRDTKAASEQAIQWREQQLGEREKTITSLEEAIQWREGQLRELTQGLDWTRNRVTEMEKTIASHEEALAWRAHQVDALESQNATLRTSLQNTQHQLGLATEQLDAIYASLGWKFILRIRHIRDRLAPAGSTRRKTFERIMKHLAPAGSKW